MDHVSIRPGDSLSIGEDITIQLDKISGGCSHLDIDAVYEELSVVRGPAPEPTEDELQTHLWELTKEIVNGISKLGLARRKEFVGALVGELYYSAAAQDRKEKRHRGQAEGIAAAKARGVRFGPKPRALPDDFEELRQAWRNKKISLKMAAELCGVPKSTFYDAAVRVEMAAEQSVDCDILPNL